MVYLDNAATGGSKPVSVQNAVHAALRLSANPGRSGHRLSVACAEQVLRCRNLLSELFGGYGYERVAFTKSCTEALNIALLGVLKEGDHVVISCLEHNSVLRPLHFLRERGVSYSVAPLSDGELRPQSFASLVKKETKMAVVTAASNVNGYVPDLAAIRAALPGKVLFVVDGAQGGGHIGIDMKKTGIDGLALAGHKGLNAMQIGALLFSPRLDPSPLIFGGTGSESFDPAMPEYYPDRLESGTLCYPAVCSLFEGALTVKEGWERNAAALLRLTGYLVRELSLLKGYRAYSAPNPCGIFSFSREGMQSEQVAAILNERFDIAVRGGLHCAPLAHRALGTIDGGLVRASFSPDQGMREANALLSALRAI